MYETFFGLKRRPFLSVPDIETYFSVDQMEEARRSIEQSVRRGEGISLVFGSAGTGKTLLLRLLRKTLRSELNVSHIANGHLETPVSLFKQLLYDLRLPFIGGDETELRLQLLDFVRQETTPGIVLLIDEAQFLNTAVLEEIRLLMDSDDGAVPHFRTVLAGTVELEEKLTHPQLEAFNQRVVSRFYLDTLSREETDQYITWQTSQSAAASLDLADTGLEKVIKLTGSTEAHRVDPPHRSRVEQIFTDGAKRLIYQKTDGLPRLINQLCDAALQHAAERSVRQVDESLVSAAWSQLQQIETATDEPVAEKEKCLIPPVEIEAIIAKKKATFQLREFDSSIEFGTLDEPEQTTALLVQPIVSYKPPYPEDDELEVIIGTPARIQLETQADTEPEPIQVVRPGEICLVDAVDEIDTEMFFAADGEPLIAKLPLADPWDEIIDVVTNAIVKEESKEEPKTEAKEIVEQTTEQVIVEEVVPAVPVFSRKAIYLTRKPPKSKKQKKYRYLKRSDKITDNAVRHFLYDIASLSWTVRSFDPWHVWMGTTVWRPLYTPVRLFAMLAVPNEIPFSEEWATSNEDSEMNKERLEQYGQEVLEGRPPFIRKEPNYAYQTTETAPEVPNDVPNGIVYPDPATGNIVVLNWAAAENFEGHIGTSYTEFLKREFAEETQTSKAAVPAPITKFAELEPLVVRVSLNASQTAAVPPRRTTLDEMFDETEQIDRLVMLPAKQKPTKKKSPQKLPESAAIDELIQRITAAAEKIEQAAEVSEQAGIQVSRSAQFVETEVKAALPTYIDLFRELSEFQKTISEELGLIPVPPREVPKLRTFPRPQVAITDAHAATIDVELLFQ